MEELGPGEPGVGAWLTFELPSSPPSGPGIIISLCAAGESRGANTGTLSILVFEKTFFLFSHVWSFCTQIPLGLPSLPLGNRDPRGPC